MKNLIFDKKTITLSINENRKRLDFNCSGWTGFSLGSLLPVIYLNGKRMVPRLSKIKGNFNEKTKVKFTYGRIFEMELQFEFIGKDVIQMRSWARNTATESIVLNRVSLLEVINSAVGDITFGKSPSRIKVMEQGNYWGKISSLAEFLPQKNTEQEEVARRVSELCWVIYNSEEKMGFVVGFETSERWLGQIEMSIGINGVIKGWNVGFDAGDLLVEPKEKLKLEEVLFLVGKDPLNLLESYGERVKLRYKVDLPEKPPVSWCSWYPYRLGVTEERILENAKVSERRLKPLGLSIIEVDLGWEKNYLPSTFEENEQFAHGLKWLSEKLKRLGFKMGVWKAPYTVSEFDSLVNEHPEWLIKDEKGKPVAYWTWFWEPHGKVFILDLTHPGAQKWLREKIVSLKRRGVQYFKVDFISCAMDKLAKRRYNQKIVFGGGCEAARIGAEIIRESLPDSLILNCGGPEMPGKGSWPLLYTCNDTGNTGYVGWDFHKDNYLSVACHLFKNSHWGILQPSCLCVGLPGSLEEARVRATVAFLTGGQIDISDNLCNLPEDRWEVLTRTLPPLGITARPIDLFDPLPATVYGYDMTSKKPEETLVKQEHTPGSVWHLHIDQDWDSWDLVGIFELESHFKKEGDNTESGRITQPEISRFSIPLERINLNPEAKYWAYEFWSGQFLGSIPSKEKNPKGYLHPGDYQSLIASDTLGMLDIAFFGPGVKLICLRKIRPHPWIVGTSFHQSIGAELKNVEWNEKKAELCGELHRPPGELGYLVFACSDKILLSAEVAKRTVPLTSLRQGSNGSWSLPIITEENITTWRICFRNKI